VYTTFLPPSGGDLSHPTSGCIANNGSAHGPSPDDVSSLLWLSLRYCDWPWKENAVFLLHAASAQRRQGRAQWEP